MKFVILSIRLFLYILFCIYCMFVFIVFLYVVFFRVYLLLWNTGASNYCFSYVSKTDFRLAKHEYLRFMDSWL